MKKEYTKEENIELYLKKDKELDLLKDENSKFVYNKSGKRILVDNDSDLYKSFCIKPRKGYVEVMVRVRKEGKTRDLSIGRFILGIKNENLITEHKNNNPLDNRKSNIRVGTHSQNLSNRNTYSKINAYKGYQITGNRIIVSCQKNGVRITYTIFSSDEEYAAIIYDCLSVSLYGEYAKTNFNVLNYTDDYIEKHLKPLESIRKIETKKDIKFEDVSILKNDKIDFFKIVDNIRFLINTQFKNNKNLSTKESYELMVNHVLDIVVQEYKIR